MKYISLIVLLAGLFALPACTKDGSGQVEVRFINATEKDLSDITINSLPVGDMPAGVTTGYYFINGFGTDTGMPDANFIATAEGKRMNSTSGFFFCGTEKSRLEPGQYTVRVKLTTVNNQQYFQLTFE
jgi:hypothetical protein